MNKTITTKACLMLMAALMALMTACSSDDNKEEVSLGTVYVGMLNFSTGATYNVQLRNTTTGSIYETTFDGANPTQVRFQVPPGTYEATVSGTYSSDGVVYSQNGTSGIFVLEKDQTKNLVVEIWTARKSQVVIKEIYNGGVMLDDGSKNFQFDKCIVLYNNSELPASLDNLCFGFASPYNGQANNKNVGADGRLSYESEGFTPALNGIWYFPSTLTIEPYQQVVVNVCGAIDNTQTVSQSVNYARADYYCMYDPESGYDNTNYYPTPADVIPTSHYLKAVRLGLGNAWALSVFSPAVYIFQVKDGSTPNAFANTESNQWYDGGTVQQSGICMIVPNEWIVDGVEVFSANHKDSSVKRLTADIDAGYVWLTNQQGHTLYRNVDQAATEALPENEGKLVYGYSLGVDSSTDPSGIDAEASIRQGAHIVYQDTNNSTADFHERQRCSLRD